MLIYYSNLKSYFIENRKIIEAGISRVIQVTAILCLVLLFYGFTTSAFDDISSILRNNPGNFWPSFLDYIIHNLSSY